MPRVTDAHRAGQRRELMHDHLGLGRRHRLRDRVAGLMVQAFGALNKPDKAAEAQEVITDARPTASTFTQLAIFAYQAGQTRKGDLAKDRAVQLTDPDMRQALKGQLEQAKQSAAGASAAAQPSATP